MDTVANGSMLGCGHVLQTPADTLKTGTGGTGYGRDRDGNTLCYACCTAKDKEQIARGESITLYYVLPKGADTRVNRFAELRRGPFEACTTGETADDDARVTNWPGSVLGKIITATVYRHNFGGRFITIRARMFNGVEYVGRASYDNGSCINLRKAVARGRR